MSKFTAEGGTLFAAGDLETGDLAAFEQAAASLLAASEGEILLDFTGVQYMPSSFLGVLMSLRGRLAKEGRSFRLRPSPVVRQLLTLTGTISAITLVE
ncbi:MAG: STAS domain-containing protein [Planctomycetota bacterium]|jgi:anti-anti-sigma factor